VYENIWVSIIGIMLKICIDKKKYKNDIRPSELKIFGNSPFKNGVQKRVIHSTESIFEKNGIFSKIQILLIRGINEERGTNF
jgi:hypothetical protein